MNTVIDTRKLYYEPTKFKANEKDIENYQTSKKEIIAYENILSPGLFDAELDNNVRLVKYGGKKFKPNPGS